MEPYSEDRLIAELQALRPTPRPQFAAELDARAAAGFPRRPGHGPNPTGTAWEHLLAWMRSMSPARLGASAGAAVLASIALATVVVALNDSTSSEPATPSAREAQADGRQTVTPTSGAGNTSGQAESVRPAHSSGGGSEVAGSSANAPSASAAGEATGSAAGSNEAPDWSGVQFESAVPSAAAAAGNAGHRDVERSAEIGLVAEPSDVDEDAAEVFRAVHRARGIVLHSTTSEGRRAGARFDLLIPAGALSDALEEISQIDRVRTRHEASADITAPTVSLGERLRASRARIDSLLGELAAAESEGEREAVEAELGRERRHAASLASRLTQLHRRANFARVEVRIEAGASDQGGSGVWGADDALHDAGRILAIAAGVALIGAAVLAPLALIALLAWLAHRAWVRAARRRALG
jgi:Domain of unknown function (DUF4349)